MIKENLLFPLVLISFFLLSGCVSMEVSREVQSGRAALRLGNPQAAISHFEAATRIDPNYISNFTLADIGIWTYLGRAYYEANDVEKALASLKRARDRTSDDYFARLYLGVILNQVGSKREGMNELEEGLKGLRVWLETIPGRSSDGQFWDPGSFIANTAGETLAMLRVEEVDWKRIKENVIWLGRNFDEEIDEVRRQSEWDQEGENDDSAMP